MFKIENKTIYCTRGDRGTITLTQDDNFAVGDKFKFSIMTKKDCNDIVFQKTYKVEESANTFSFTLTEDDTRIGDIISKPVTYWYEVEYNEDQTIIGYDEDGAKEFILYPEAKEE